jgi:hypothetical protein
MGRQIEDSPTSPYGVLGLSRYATPEDIKHAYREKAKRSHPDAGGSASAMERVNEAYGILSDPARRLRYDAQKAQAPIRSYGGYSQASQPQNNQSAPASVQHPRGARPFNVHESEAIHHSRTVWARRSAWELLRFSAPLSLLAVFGARYARNYLPQAGNVFVLDYLLFIPVYATVLGLVFIVDPSLRLIYADFMRGHYTTKHERLTALALLGAFFPLAGIWSLMFIAISS